jgi:hypothetical protein
MIIEAEIPKLQSGGFGQGDGDLLRVKMDDFCMGGTRETKRGWKGKDR